MMENCESLPEKLYVYECWGHGFPRIEPEGNGYLGIWPEAPFYYIFYDRHARESVSQWLLENGAGWFLRDCYQMNYSQWQQISGASKEVGPFCIQIAANPQTTPSLQTTAQIRLNPGVVFGTGLHETTKGCLLTIADLFEQKKIKSVVDLGTGTGILALACALLGATKITAVDCNPLAVRIARDNVILNNREKAINLLVAQDLSIFRRPSKLLLMNLEWPCLMQVLAERQWIDYRWVIMSGFLRSQLPELRDRIAGFSDVLLERNLDGWMTLLVETNSLEAE